MSVTKSAKAFVAARHLDEIILERYLVKALPQTKLLSYKKAYEYTGYKYYSLRSYIKSDLFSIRKESIEITNDSQLLKTKSKEHIDYLIKKAVFPSEYEHDDFTYDIGKFLDVSYYTAEEKRFIALMTDELLSIINYKDFISQISATDLFNFNSLNLNGFNGIARKIYNEILQRKLHVGDSIISYFKDNFTDNEIAERLERGCKYDYFFDNNGILKCDLDTNKNILIKNFLNTILYDFTDQGVRSVLLIQLNSKYPFLIKDKIFHGFS